MSPRAQCNYIKYNKVFGSDQEIMLDGENGCGERKNNQIYRGYGSFLDTVTT